MHLVAMSTIIPPLRMSAAKANPDTGKKRLIVPFGDARRRDVPSLGGKGANLGEMTAAGFTLIGVEGCNGFKVDPSEVPNA